MVLKNISEREEERGRERGREEEEEEEEDGGGREAGGGEEEGRKRRRRRMNLWHKKVIKSQGIEFSEKMALSTSLFIWVSSCA